MSAEFSVQMTITFETMPAKGILLEQLTWIEARASALAGAVSRRHSASAPQQGAWSSIYA